MIISSLLDTDLYKFTMMQVVLHHFPNAQVEYHFKCRNTNINLVQYIDVIKKEVNTLCGLRFQKQELAYLRTFRFIKNDFVDFLSFFYLDEKYISITSSNIKGEINIQVKGPWLYTILFEVPILAIVNEVYFRATQNIPDYITGKTRLHNKIALLINNPLLKGCKIADYGTRRRFSHNWHAEVINIMKKTMGQNFAGTSNVFFAMKHNLTALGTMAHEYLQACQALGPSLRGSQIYGFDIWAREYRGDLGIALADVYGVDAFLRDFDMYFCKLFDGARHDSGDPFEWGERVLQHYRNNHIDTHTKVLVFSDNLDFNKVTSLYLRFKNHVQVVFGVGTNLTNDLGYTPLQIVIKMVSCNGQPVAKLSDTPAKNMCADEAYMKYLRQIFQD